MEYWSIGCGNAVVFWCKNWSFFYVFFELTILYFLYYNVVIELKKRVKTMLNKGKFFLVLLACAAFNAYAGGDGWDDNNTQKVIIVYKVPKEEMIAGTLVSWHEVGLSRNGKEPVEYIWRTESRPHKNPIMYAPIGDSGTISLTYWAIQNNKKLPEPNAKNPPVIGALIEQWNFLR